MVQGETKQHSEHWELTPVETAERILGLVSHSSRQSVVYIKFKCLIVTGQ